MFKFRTLCLFLFVAFSSSVVNARVCFLPGVFASDGCMSGDAMISCQTHYTQTTPCEEGQVQRTCVENGVTYYKCDCPETNIITGYKYQCIGNEDPVCGCPSNQTKCSDVYYPFKGCGDFENSYGSEDFCDSPSDGERYYSYCKCSRNDYPYTCTEKGLKVSSTAGKCTDSHGKTYYEYCDCADNWSTGDCAENSDGCTVLVDGPVDRGGSLNCYRCGSEACSDPSQLNLEAYFCLNPDVTTTVVQCENLGYVYSTDGICPDGTAGLKCIFDSNYIFCETKTAVECKYASEADCLAPEGNETCVVNYDGCNVVTKCKQGYKLSADRSQCEEIVCDINEREYLNQSTCLASMKNVKCKKDSKGCYVVDGCVNGYLLSADGTTCEADCSLQEAYMTCDNGKGLYGSGDECVNTAIPSTSYHEACVVGEECYNVNSTREIPYRANGGSCELVLSVEQANTHLRNGYYQVGDPCQPVDADLGKKIRLHSCKSTSRDCKGGYSPVYNYKTECLNSNDAGLSKTCGGQKYTDCICNDRQDYGGCYVREITKDTKVGFMKNNDYYIYTGEVKNGCEGYKKQYGYFRSITGLKKCKKSSENIDEAVAVCVSGSNKCPEGSEIQSANYYGTVYTRCKVPCVSIMSCEQYAQNNGISTTSNCKFSSSIPSGYTKLGEETISDENGSRKCYYLANCKSDLDGVCATLNANFEKIPSNYENCGYYSYNVPSNLDYKICNTSIYAEKCCNSKSNCRVSNDYEQYMGYISTGIYYEVTLNNVPEGCFYYAECSLSSTDCSGKVSPINNAKTQAQCAAAGGFGVNPIAECGGKYFEACSSECKYKNTEESCSKLGMNFRAKCVGNDFRYGECY